MDLRSIVIAHGKEDAFHIPLNVILRCSTRNSVFARWMMLETPYMVRSRLKLLLHLPNRRARQCVALVQHIDINVDDENYVPDVKFQTNTPYWRILVIYWSSARVKHRRFAAIVRSPCPRRWIYAETRRRAYESSRGPRSSFTDANATHCR